MAKRRKEKDEENEDKPFKTPKFNEEAFLKRERRNIKITFITFFFGCLMALICFGFWVLLSGSELRWPLVLMVGIFNASFLRYILLRLNFDLSELTRKNWFTSYAIYFFVWLIILIILVNPPFYDDEAPGIEVAVLPEMQEPGGTVLILAKITDNTGVDKEDIMFTIDDVAISSNDFDYDDTIFIYTYESPIDFNGDETHNYEISITDASGNSKTKQGSFTFSNDTIDLGYPFDRDLINTKTPIKFIVKPDVFRVYYTINEGGQINTTQDTVDKQTYGTTPEMNGWIGGTNNVTVNVSAQVIYNFENHFLKNEKGNIVYIKDSQGNQVPVSYWFVNYINDTASYTFDVADEPSIGTEAGKKISVPKGRIVGAPGFEAIVFIAALLVVVLIFKYKKKDRRN